MKRSKNRLMLKALVVTFMAVLAVLALATTAPASTTYHVFAVDVQDLAFTLVSVTNLGTTNVSVTIQAYDSSGIPVGSAGAETIAAGTQWNLTTGSGHAGYSGAPQNFVGYALITTSADTVALLGAVLIVDTNGVRGFILPFTKKL